jgi:hypothetical protein
MFLKSPRRSIGRRFFLLALLISVSQSVGCGNADVSGRVLIPVSPGNFRPAGNVEVLLVKGNVEAVLKRMAEQYDAQAVTEAAASTLGTLKERYAKQAAELESIKAALPAMGRADGVSGCKNGAEAAATQAQQRYLLLSEKLKPELKALGVETESTQTIVEKLQAELDRTLGKEAQRLAQEYLATQVVLRSSVVLNVNAQQPDRLCWSLTNKGHLKLIAASLQVAYKGKPLPAALAKQYWSTRFDLRSVPLTVRNRYGQEVQGLASGSTFTDCFNAATPALTLETQRDAEAYGLPAGVASRSGSWSLAIGGGVLTNADAVTVRPAGASVAHVEYPIRPLVDVLAPEIRGIRERSPQGRIIAALTDSAEARTLKTAEKELAACRRAAELDEQGAEIARAIKALEEGKTNDPAARKALDEFVREIKEKPEKRSALVAKSEQHIESQLVTFQRTAVDGTFLFSDVPAGEYTLIASSKTTIDSSVSWITSIVVKRGVNQELGKQNSYEGTLTEVLDRIVTQGPREARHAPLSQTKSRVPVATKQPTAK